MPSSMNVSLTNELKKFVVSRTGDDGLYATPSEYIRNLIRGDMATQETVLHVLSGLNDIKHGRMSEKSILDIHDEA
jgi:antitoxin ParD1/3/4